jgi:PAS domain S-box-containing protein
MLLIGDDYKIYKINKRTSEISGYSEKELVGTLCDIVCPKGSLSKKCPIFAKGQEGFIGMDTAVKCKDGRKNPVLKNAKRIIIKGKTYIMENFQDVTRQKAAEEKIMQYQVNLEEKVRKRTRELEKAKFEAEFANKAKSDFLSNMSHELRTPLNGVLGFTDLIIMQEDGKLSDKQLFYLENVKESGRHLLALINDILDISKIESGKVKLDVKEFSLNKLLERSLLLAKEKAASRGIEFVTESREKIKIKADETKIKQIVFNLLSNAVKFTPDGGTITIKLTKIKNLAQISVRDTGIGIDDKNKDKVFCKFEQIDTGQTRRYGGVGLGLSLTKKIVEMHNGKIWFNSAGKNKGTCFFVQLPLK